MEAVFTGEDRRCQLPHSYCQDCDASIQVDPIWVKPRLRRAAALRSLGRVAEAGQEYERVVCMEEGCKEAQEGLRDCKQETGELNNKELNLCIFCLF